MLAARGKAEVAVTCGHSQHGSAGKDRSSPSPSSTGKKPGHPVPAVGRADTCFQPQRRRNQISLGGSSYSASPHPTTRPCLAFDPCPGENAPVTRNKELKKGEASAVGFGLNCVRSQTKVC